MIRGFIIDKRNAEGFDPDEGSVKIDNKDVKEIEAFIEPIRMKYRQSELAREEELSKTREAKAQREKERRNSLRDRSGSISASGVH